MDRVLGLVIMTLLVTMSAGVTARQNLTTLDDFFHEQYGHHIHHLYARVLLNYTNFENDEWKSIFGNTSKSSEDVKNVAEILQYLSDIKVYFMFQFIESLEYVNSQDIYNQLNDHCSQYLATPVKDLREETSNTTCVRGTLVKWLTLRLIMVINITLQESSGLCFRKEMSICSTKNLNYTLEYDKRIAQQLRMFIEDTYDGIRANGTTPLLIIARYQVDTIKLLSDTFDSIFYSLSLAAKVISSISSIEPFVLENILYPFGNKIISPALFEQENKIKYLDDFTWGIVRSYTGVIDYPCFNYKTKFIIDCFVAGMIRSSSNLMQSVNEDAARRALAWSTVPSLYVHSQCLCLASNGKDCGVKAHEGVDPRIYCLSVLLRDFQRQVWYRPAVTYLDYAFQTRVHSCKFSYLLSVNFRTICMEILHYGNFKVIQSVQCYFKDIVNKELNCTEPLTINTFNGTELCAAMYFIQLVLCEDDANDEVRVPYYGAGDSILVLVLTYLDVTVRVLTMVTYLASPQLRNLPGKLLSCYLMTSVLRLLVVRLSLENLTMAVRLDVAMDLASILWLTAYLHFLTVSIMDLQPPDSLSPDEARMVLLRYALMGWALPAALSAAFFSMDEILQGRVQFGQVLFVVCNYAALLANLYMFYKNFKFYYEVKSSAHELLKRVKARSIFADLLNFALKTSILSGAGISFRLIFTHIQGLEHVLGYYHALGTLQGLLLFLLYGCNREARNFWLSVFRLPLHLCNRNQNTSPRRNSFELVQIPFQNVAGQITEVVPATID